MVLRFLRMAIVTFVSFSVLAVPILIPINLVDQRDSEGLNRLTMGNVKDPERTWAHLVLSVVLSGESLCCNKQSASMQLIVFLFLFY